MPRYRYFLGRSLWRLLALGMGTTRVGRIKKRAQPSRADLDVDPIGPDVDALY